MTPEVKIRGAKIQGAKIQGAKIQGAKPSYRLKRRKMLAMFLLVGIGTLVAQENLKEISTPATPLKVLSEHRSIFTDGLDMVWRNPALQPLRYNSSFTEITAGARLTSEYRGGSFKADTWLKSSKATITGYAGYDNGKYRKGIIYDTSDTEITSPYLMYANGPGTLNNETYRFGGSYMARLGRWNAGVAAGYQAGLSYRTVDPRPRNVTGLLSVTPAGSVRIGNDYLLAGALTYMRYKQTNNLKFVSELGSITVYHLTGLGTTYGRFDGTGNSTYYSGHSWGGRVGIMPYSSGFFVASDFSRMKLSNVLADFNNLPLAHTSTLDLSGIAGWKNNNWIIAASGYWQRRRGTENIFGDPVSGQYPLIGALTLYSRTIREIILSATFRHRATAASMNAGWYSRFEQHLAPLRHMEWQRFAVTARAQQQLHIGKSGYLGIKGDISFSSPLSSSVAGVESTAEDIRTLTDAIREQYATFTGNRFFGGIGGEALFPLKGNRMLGGDIEWRRDIYGVSEVKLGLQLVL